MCDLLAMSAGKDFSAPEVLPLFAVRASKNMDGWGIGYFKKQHAVVEKSAHSVCPPGSMHDSFQRLARVAQSRIIVSHIRFKTSGLVDECHAHPFILHFIGYDWIFAHNGRAPAIEPYRTAGEAIAGAVSDSARVFEYLRDQTVSRFTRPGGLSGLFHILQQSIEQLLYHYPGNYNFLLTNGHLLLAFTNHRQFMVLRGSRRLEGALLLTTLEHGVSKEPWRRLARSTSRQGLLLAIAGTEIVLKRPV